MTSCSTSAMPRKGPRSPATSACPCRPRTSTRSGPARRSAGLPQQDGGPVCDLILLGIGPDGHLLSVFPGSPALNAPELAMAISPPTHVEPNVEGVTLNPAVIGVARQVIVVISGAEKAGVVADILGPERDPRRWPGELARREGAVWILDAAAASRLPGR